MTRVTVLGGGNSGACSGWPASRSASTSRSSIRRRRAGRSVGDSSWPGARRRRLRLKAAAGATSSPTSGKACPPPTRLGAADAVRSVAAGARGLAGPARREDDIRGARHQDRALSRGRRSRVARGRGRRARAARGVEDAPRRLRRQRSGGTAVGRRRRRRVGSARRRALDPRGLRRVRPRALDRRRASVRRHDALLARRREHPRGRHPAAHAGAGAGARRRCKLRRRGMHPAAARRARLRRRRLCRAVRRRRRAARQRDGPARAQQRPLDDRGRRHQPVREPSARSLGWPLGSTAARRERDGQLHRRDARPRCRARDPGRAPARLRQVPRPGRKVGHVTVTAADARELEDPLARACRRSGSTADGRLASAIRRSRRSRAAWPPRPRRRPSRPAPRRCAGPATAPIAAPRPRCARSAARARAAARRRAR